MSEIGKTLRCQRDDLINLLKKTQRPQVVAGKKQDQVYSTIIKSAENNRAYTVSLVKDGVTSLSRFSIPVEESIGDIPISNINDILGVLSMHSPQILMTFYSDRGKLKITSRRKQTTITTNKDSLAFPHNPETLSEWVDKAENLSEKFILLPNSPSLNYRLKTGGIVTPYALLNISANELYEALRCDGINSQKLNKYTFLLDDEGMFGEFGGELKGKTSTLLSEEPFFKSVCEVNGGLENVMKLVDGDVLMVFLELGNTPSLIIQLGNGDFIFQAGNKENEE